MPFVKGKSGNPGGRKLTSQAALEVARRHCRSSLRKVIAILREPLPEGAEDRADLMRLQLKAAEIILDRGIGTPAPAAPLSQFTDEELVEELAERRTLRADEEQRSRASDTGKLDS